MVFSVTAFSKRQKDTEDHERDAQTNGAFLKGMVNQRSLGSEWVKQTSNKD